MLVLGKWSERRVISCKLFGHLCNLFVVLKIVSHELEQGLLLSVMLNLPLQMVAVLLKFLTSVLVDLDFVL